MGAGVTTGFGLAAGVGEGCGGLRGGALGRGAGVWGSGVGVGVGRACGVEVVDGAGVSEARGVGVEEGVGESVGWGRGTEVQLPVNRSSLAGFACEGEAFLRSAAVFVSVGVADSSKFSVPSAEREREGDLRR